MLTYEKFEEYMNDLKELIRKEDKLDDALKEMSPDFGGFYTDAPSLIVELLEKIMNDENDWIGYYIWDTNWGKDMNVIWDTNDNEIPFETIKDLYNVLTGSEEK